MAAKPRKIGSILFKNDITLNLDFIYSSKKFFVFLYRDPWQVYNKISLHLIKIYIKYHFVRQLAAIA